MTTLPRLIASVVHDEVVVGVLAAATASTSSPTVRIVGPVAGLAEGVEVQAIRAVEEVQFVFYTAGERRRVGVVAVERSVVSAFDSEPVGERWLRPSGQNGQHRHRYEERGARDVSVVVVVVVETGHWRHG